MPISFHERPHQHKPRLHASEVLRELQCNDALISVYQRTQKEKREGEVECGHKHYIYMMEDSGQVGEG